MKTTTRQRLARIGAPLIVLVLGVAGMSLLKATAPKPDIEEVAPRPVTVYTHLAESSDAVIEVLAQGEVRARTMIDLTAQVAGRVVAVAPAYVEGGRFDADTVLLQIDDSDYRFALREAEAAVAAADLGVQQAVADAQVARQQLRGVPDASDLSLKKPQIVEARARYEAALAGLELARLNFARTRVSLPFEGRVASTTAHIGQVISVGSTLGEVFSTDRVEVRLSLNDEQLAALDLPIGFSAEGEDAPSVIFSAEVAGREHRWTGHLRHIDAAIDASTRLIYATAELEDPYGAGRSAGGMPMAVGLFVNARIAGRALTDVVRIPAQGLRPGNQIYVVGADGLLDIRKASVASVDADHAILTGGVHAGERVVVSALRDAIPGMRLATLDASDYALAEP
jgi:RND family efflux transporter MFP subunit